MTAFTSFADFFAMGGYGTYIWTAYGLCLVLMALNVVQPLLARRSYLNDLVRRRRRKVSP